jgi:hypothetical protein
MPVSALEPDAAAIGRLIRSSSRAFYAADQQSTEEVP